PVKAAFSKEGFLLDTVSLNHKTCFLIASDRPFVPCPDLQIQRFSWITFLCDLSGKLQNLLSVSFAAKLGIDTDADKHLGLLLQKVGKAHQHLSVKVGVEVFLLFRVCKTQLILLH